MSRIAFRSLLPVAGLSLILAAPAAQAQNIFLPNDTTLDASNPVSPPYSVTVGWASFDDEINGVNPTSPTISIVNGASINQLDATNGSIINMSGGNVGSGDFLGKLRSSDNSTINISGGNVLFDLNTQFNSAANFSGGEIGDDIVTNDDSVVNMSGGTVDQDLLINNNSIFNLSGGKVLDEVFVGDGSTLNVIGSSLTSVLNDPDFEGFYSMYTLSGSLADNTDLTGRVIFVQNNSGASLALINQPAAVPEPGNLACVLGVFAGGLFLKRRRK